MDELIHGAAMTGVQRVPFYAEQQIAAAPSAKEMLESMAVWRRQGSGTKRLKLDSCPFRSPEAVTEVLGRSDWLANPQFVLYQGVKGKPRIINDAKLSGLNDTYSLGEKLRLQDVDQVALMCLQAGRMSSKPQVSVTLSSGKVLTGKKLVSRPSW